MIVPNINGFMKTEPDDWDKAVEHPHVKDYGPIFCETVSDYQESLEKIPAPDVTQEAMDLLTQLKNDRTKMLAEAGFFDEDYTARENYTSDAALNLKDDFDV
jgi:hypothetical protein